MGPFIISLNARAQAHTGCISGLRVWVHQHGPPLVALPVISFHSRFFSVSTARMLVRFGRCASLARLHGRKPAGCNVFPSMPNPFALHRRQSECRHHLRGLEGEPLLPIELISRSLSCCSGVRIAST